jgi:hypothetical protein
MEMTKLKKLAFSAVTEHRKIHKHFIYEDDQIDKLERY